jgi:alkane 1-monooxygenase
MRKKEADGDYERTNVTFSWNAPQALSNSILFKLQRHADHHESVYKPYQALLSYDESPQLPAGYTVLAPICYVTPLWFSIMNPRIDMYKKQKKIDESLESSNRAKILLFTLVGAAASTFMMYTSLPARIF